MKRVDEELLDLKKKGYCKMGQVFKIAKSVKGDTEESGRANAIKDPNNGNLIETMKISRKCLLNIARMS